MTTKNSLTTLPNIGTVLAHLLNSIGIETKQELIDMGAEEAITRLSRIENVNVCINKLMALEGAIQGIRWHHLSKEKKEELKEYFNTFIATEIK